MRITLHYYHVILADAHKGIAIVHIQGYFLKFPLISTIYDSDSSFDE